MSWTIFHHTKDVFYGFKVDLALGERLQHVFHIGNLKRYLHFEGFSKEFQPPLLVIVDDHPEYKVEDLIYHRHKGYQWQYLVLWKKVSIYWSNLGI